MEEGEGTKSLLAASLPLSLTTSFASGLASFGLVAVVRSFLVPPIPAI